MPVEEIQLPRRGVHQQSSVVGLPARSMPDALNARVFDPATDRENLARRAGVSRQWQDAIVGSAGGSFVGHATTPPSSYELAAGDVLLSDTFNRATSPSNTLNHIAWWDWSSPSAGAWSVLSGGLLGGDVRAMLYSGGTLYVGGSFTSADGATTEGFATWNGTAWTASTPGWTNPSGANPTIYAIANNGTVFVVGGAFAGGSPAYNNIAQYSGGVFSTLSSGSSGCTTYALEVNGAAVYFGGSGVITPTGGLRNAKNIGQWDGTSTVKGLGTTINTSAGVTIARAVSGWTGLSGLSSHRFYVGGDYGINNWGGVSGVGVGEFDSDLAKWAVLDGTKFSGQVTYSLYAQRAPTSSSADRIFAGMSDNGGANTENVRRYRIGYGWSTLIQTNGDVLAVLPTTNTYSGEIVYIAGDFTTNNKLTSAGDDAILKLTVNDSGGSVSVTAAAVATNAMTGTQRVRALAEGTGSNIYAGGDFTTIDGVANTARIAKYDGATWTALGTGGAGGNVYAIAHKSSSALFAAGTFTSMGGVASTASIAKWDGAAWSSISTGITGTATVRALAYTSTTIGSTSAGWLVVAGDFSTINGVASTAGIALYNTDTGAWSALGTGISGGNVHSVAFCETTDASKSVIVAVGDFTSAGGVTVNGVAIWDGTRWFAPETAPDGTVYALRLVGTNLYVGGSFSSAGGVSASNLAVYDLNNQRWSSVGANGAVRALMLQGADLYAGGEFTTIGPSSVAANRVAVLSGGVWSAFGTGANGTVHCLAWYDDTVAARLHIGGTFSTADGASCLNIAKWDAPTTDFMPLSGGLSNTVYAMVENGSTNLFVGGAFMQTLATGISGTGSDEQWTIRRADFAFSTLSAARYISDANADVVTSSSAEGSSSPSISENSLIATGEADGVFELFACVNQKVITETPPYILECEFTVAPGRAAGQSSLQASYVGLAFGIGPTMSLGSGASASDSEVGRCVLIKATCEGATGNAVEYATCEAWAVQLRETGALVPFGYAGVVNIAAGATHTMQAKVYENRWELYIDGALIEYGQFSDGTTNNNLSPSRVGLLVAYVGPTSSVVRVDNFRMLDATQTTRREKTKIVGANQGITKEALDGDDPVRVYGTVVSGTAGRQYAGTPMGTEGAGSNSDGFHEAEQRYFYFVDGFFPWKYNIGRRSISPWGYSSTTAKRPPWTYNQTAGAARVGTSPKIVVGWRSRIMCSGWDVEPFNWYGCRFNEPEDWQFDTTDGAGDPDPFGAIAGSDSNTKVGRSPDLITCLAPTEFDDLFMGCKDSIYLFRGDPGLGGTLENIVRGIGIVGAHAWARDHQGTMYFVTQEGLIRMRRDGGGVERMTQGRMDTFMRNIDYANSTVHLAWDAKNRGLHIFVVHNTIGTVVDHLWWDQRANAFLPDRFPSLVSPRAAAFVPGVGGAAGKLLLMGGDGVLRYVDPLSMSDDSLEIAFRADILVVAGLQGERAILSTLELGTTGSTGEFDVEISRSGDPQAVLSESPRWIETRRGPGQVRPISLRSAGEYLRVRVSQDSATETLVLERIGAMVERGGVI